MADFRPALLAAVGYVAGTPVTLWGRARTLWRRLRSPSLPGGADNPFQTMEMVLGPEREASRERLPLFEYIEGPSISLEEVKKRRFMNPEQMAELQAKRQRLLSVLQQRQVVNAPTAWERLLRG